MHVRIILSAIWILSCGTQQGAGDAGSDVHEEDAEQEIARPPRWGAYAVSNQIVPTQGWLSQIDRIAFTGLHRHHEIDHRQIRGEVRRPAGIIRRADRGSSRNYGEFHLPDSDGDMEQWLEKCDVLGFECRGDTDILRDLVPTCSGGETRSSTTKASVHTLRSSWH
jgi:hypothetical protein